MKSEINEYNTTMVPLNGYRKFFLIIGYDMLNQWFLGSLIVKLSFLLLIIRLNYVTNNYKENPAINNNKKYPI